MLHLVTMPPTWHTGTYTIEEITADEAASRIRNAADSDELKSHINFASTKKAIEGLTGLRIDMVQRINVPVPRDGDCFLHIRLRTRASRDRVGLADLAFFWADYTA